MNTRNTLVSLTAMATLFAVTACGAPEKETDTTTESGVDAASATSAEDFGGMDELVKAAQEEGELNVIALPPDWANYGEIITTFEDKYDIKVNSAQPDAASQDEINAAKQLAGTSRAPDVFDLGQSVALANTDMFAPYKVETFDDIPDEFKDPDGTWVNDYGGYMSIGYDSAQGPGRHLARGPAQARVQGQGRAQRRPDAGRRGVQRRDDGGGRQRRLRRRHRARRRLLRRAQEGRQLPAGRPDSRHDRVRTDARSSSTGTTSTRPRPPSCRPGRSSSRTTRCRAGYYYQAINADAPHPAAARLWQEFLYSDEGQNLWLAGGARPVRADAMVEAGTIDQDAVRRPARGRRRAR